jgi:hypothetical protein
MDPDTLREEIARKVLGQFDGDEPDADEITKRVLSSFGIETRHLRPSSGNGAKRDRGESLL